MLLKLELIRFVRSFKPDGADPNVDPDLITFDDGNPDAFGAVAYALWTLTDYQGSEADRVQGQVGSYGQEG